MLNTNTSNQQLAILANTYNENTPLQALLQSQNIQVIQLLSIKNIQSKIRSNFPYFIRYCQKNEEFCNNLIDIGIKCPMHQSTSEKMKNIGYIAAEILTCDQDIVANLFIQSYQISKRKESGFESDEFEQVQIQENIETQSQKDRNSFISLQPLSKQQEFNKKYKYLISMLTYIQYNERENIDQNCINYMIKVLNCLVRVKSQQFCVFLLEKEHILRKLLQINEFSSINQFLIKILSQDELDQPQYSNIKKLIVENMLQKLKKSIKEQNFYQRLDFLDELFQTNKYSTEDERTQTQKLSDIFVNEPTINFFLTSYFNPSNGNEFYNATSYLLTMVKRQNADEQNDPCAYTQNIQQRQPTMKFQLDEIFTNFPRLISSGIGNITKYSQLQHYNKHIETSLYEFWVILVENKKFANTLTNNIVSSRQNKLYLLKQLITQFSLQKSNGINRINLIYLIEKVLQLRIQQPTHLSNTIIHEQNQKITTLKVQQNNFIAKKQQQLFKMQSNQANESNQTQASVEKQESFYSQSPEHIKQDEQSEDITDKKKKINKLKIGLKLNIKKFHLDDIANKKQEEPKIQQIKSAKNQFQTQQQHIQKLQKSLTLKQAWALLHYLQQKLLDQIQHFVQGSQKDKNNFKIIYNKTQCLAFINKLIILISNKINWNEKSLNIQTEKKTFIHQLTQIFNSFTFEKISQEYAVTLATTKHPNAQNNCKLKPIPQLSFSEKFLQIYSNKSDKTVIVINKQHILNELNYNDFVSDDDLEQDNNVVAVKCSLEDIKNMTAFKFDSVPIKKNSTFKQLNFVKAQSIEQEILQKEKETQKIVEAKPQTIIEELALINQNKQTHSYRQQQIREVSQNKQIKQINKNQISSYQIIETTQSSKRQQKYQKILQNPQIQNPEYNKTTLSYFMKHLILF